MPFADITRSSLEILEPNLRAPGVAAGGMLPGSGDAAAPADPSYGCADQFLRILPFVNATDAAHARVYQAQLSAPLAEPGFTARGGGTAWTSGAATPFGQELTLAGARFKKVENVVRVDRLMTPEMQEAQALLAKQSLLRSLAEAVLGSNPASDDNRELAGLPYYLPSNSTQDVLYDSTRKRRRGGIAEIITRVRPGGDGLGAKANVVVTASQVIWGIANEVESLGVSPDYRHCPLTGSMELHYLGVPIIEGRVPQPAPAAGQPAVTVAWAINLFSESGVRMFHHGGDAFGVVLEPATTIATLDAANEARGATSGLSVYGNYALLVPDPRAIARLRGIPLDPYA